MISQVSLHGIGLVVDAITRLDKEYLDDIKYGAEDGESMDEEADMEAEEGVDEEDDEDSE